MNPRPLFALLTLLITFGLSGCASNQQPESQKETTWQSRQSTTPESAAVVHNLLQVFNRYEGTPYRYGGTSASGFDCSGFIATAFDEALGRQLPRTTSQMLSAGEAVEPDQLRAGDVVFFRIKGKNQHAGIYIGENSFIHSSTSVGVTRSSLNGYYWQGRLSQVRRFE